MNSSVGCVCGIIMKLALDVCKGKPLLMCYCMISLTLILTSQAVLVKIWTFHGEVFVLMIEVFVFSSWNNFVDRVLCNVSDS